MEQTLEPSPESPGRWMRRLGREEFARLMGACIETVLERRGGFTADAAGRVRAEALRRFSLLLELRTPRVRALTKSDCMRELESSHSALQRERLRQASELAGIERELAQARGPQIVQEFLPFEQRTLEQALTVDIEALLASADPRAGVAALVARERERRAEVLADMVGRERERIDLLERRLVKARAAHEELERALAELARRAAIDGGLASIYRDVQGVDPEDTLREAKTALLATLFEQNLEFQKRPA